MNQPPGPIILAREADFALGGALVRPALRSFAAKGAQEIVEPRVMQVLVALARRTGEVVGRDDLATTCWEGRIVGEDALQRAIGKVRRLGEASGAFVVETIPRVGYRLTGSAQASTTSDAPAPAEPAPASTPPASPRPIIAILPFAARSGLPEDDAFADALVADVTAALSRSQWVKVVAASAAAVYRQAARPLRQIGRELGARYLLEGNLRRIGEDLRVSIQIVEAAHENIVWTQTFDRPLAGLTEHHDALVEEMAAHLAAQLRRVEFEQGLKKAGGVNAWDAFVAISASLFRYPNRSSYEAAVALAEKAVAIDPNDAAGYAILASAQGQLLHHRGGADAGLERQSTENMRQARALDPDKVVVLTGIAAAFIGLRRLHEALPLAERAAAKSPSDDTSRHILAAVYARLGRLDEALAELDAGDRLAPDGTWSYVSALNRSIAYFRAGQVEQALATAEPTVRHMPGPELSAQVMLCLAKLQRQEAARDVLRRLLDIEPDISRALLDGLIRSLYCAAPDADVLAALVGDVWEMG
jgi:TolB-like protein